MNQYMLPLIVVATMLVADPATAKGPHGPKGGMPEQSRAIANSNGVRSLDRDKGQARAAERRNLHATIKSHPKRNGPKPRVLVLR